MAGGRPVILDTCALLWLASDDKKLSRRARKEIEAAPVVYVLAISGFEIAMKVGKGKLTLPLPPQEWFEKIVENHGLEVMALELNVCMAAAQLPPLHDDPCDRFIIAAAKTNDHCVVTADLRFKEYGITVLT